ncbi:MAG: hydrogenase expression/formation protein [Gallionella sp.]|nr:hydrogenase expression/formation protein [Gallionella sp.]
MKPQTIPIYTQTEADYSVGNIRALLTEIAARLERLANDGTSASIDLNSLPFAPGEYERLRHALGKGEVSAHIEAIGPSEITETRYPGVWWVTHYNVEGDIVADMLEITTAPEILSSQPDDIRSGLALLHIQLKEEVQQ